MSNLYRSRPTTIEAMQWKGDNYSRLFDFTDEKVTLETDWNGEPSLLLYAGVNGAQGWVTVPVNHWVVRNPGDTSDLWPVDPEYFAAKYEPAVDESE